MGYAERDEESVVSQTKADLKDRETRRQAAVAMRVAGANYADIARALDYSSGFTARRAVETALARTVGEGDKDQLRTIDSRRLERLLSSLWPKATNAGHPEHLVAVRTALALIDRHARLYGLDAPTEAILYTPSRMEVEQFVAAATASMRSQFPDEPDIIESTAWNADEDEPDEPELREPV